MLDHLVESRDLTVIHSILSLVGGGLGLYVMQLVGRDERHPPAVQWALRASLAVLTLALFWSLLYSLTKQWQPWPPEILLHFGLIVLLATWASILHKRLDVYGPPYAPRR